tara:strand:+ start:29 stop:553 length:525 start_codon:yes stop_codon:yes gene_type:complete
MTIHFGDSTSIATGSGVGNLVNYAQVVKTDSYSAQAAQGDYATGDAISLDYAASSSSNKLLIIAQLAIGSNITGRVGAGLHVGGNLDSGAIGDSHGSNTRLSTAASTGGDSRLDTMIHSYIKSSPSTSSTTYSYRLWQGDNATQYVYLNRTHWNGTQDYGHRMMSSITILEFKP